MDNIKAFYAQTFENMKHMGIQNPEKDYDTFCASPSIITEYNANKNIAIDKVDEYLLEKIDQFIMRRTRREPLERIMNCATFCGLNFEIAPTIFKPAFETETTVDHALEQIKNIQNPVILDCGTGSGCILISLLRERPDATGIGIDIDQSILDIAIKNATTHNVLDRVQFMISNWGDNIDQKVDLIISNPPRIPTKLIQSLVKEVSIYDPHIALDGGSKGVDFYKRSAELLSKNGTPKAVCVLQVGQVIIQNAIKSIRKSGYSEIHIGRNYKFTPNCLIFHKTNYQQQCHTIQNLLELLRK